MKSNRPTRIGFLLLSSLAFSLILGLVWAITLRENDVRRLDLEFEAYRASTSLVEAYLEDPNSIRVDPTIIGFGLYTPRGEALLRQGSAPSSFIMKRPMGSSYTQSSTRASVILVRPLGAEGGNGMMGDMMRGSGMDPPLFDGNQAQGREEGLGTFRQQPRILWLELSTGAHFRKRLGLLAAAAIISLALFGLYLLLLRLYRRNGELQEKNAKDRELIQLGEAARTLAHEIKNPLAIIRIQTATLRRLASDPGRAGDYGSRVDIIDEEVERLVGLSDRIREFLKSGPGEAGRIELPDFLEEVAARYCGGAQTVMVLGSRPEDSEARVFADPERLGQALDNLLRNALEASSPGQSVELGLEGRGRHWTIQILDRGPGIPQELEERIFEPFFTTKERGSGIGLALARKIAESAGGSLVYHHRQGGGSVFSLSLPRA